MPRMQFIEWDEIKGSEAYTSLGVEDQAQVRAQWLKENLVRNAEFLNLSEEDQVAVLNQWEKENGPGENK